MRLFAIIFGLIGIIAAGKGVVDLWRGISTTSWPETTGVVLESEIETRRGTGRRRGVTHKPVITYQYEVNGQTFTANRYRIATLSGPRGMAEGVVETYQIGTSAVIRYHPERPEEAVLVTGPGGGVWLMLVLGALFGGVGGVLLLSTFRAAPVRDVPRRQPSRKRRPRLGFTGTVLLLGTWGAIVYFVFVRPSRPTQDEPSAAPAPLPTATEPISGARPFTVSGLGRGYSVEGEFRGHVARDADRLTLDIDRAMLIATSRVREPVVIQFVRAQLAVESGRSWSPRASSRPAVVNDTVIAGDSLILRDLRFTLASDDIGPLDDKMLVFEIGLREPDETQVGAWTYARSPVGALDPR